MRKVGVRTRAALIELAGRLGRSGNASADVDVNALEMSGMKLPVVSLPQLSSALAAGLRRPVAASCSLGAHVRLSYRMAANLFEAAEATGVRRTELASPLGLDADALVDPRRGIDWDTLVALLEQLSKRVDGDVERIRDVGREMASVPSFALLRRIGRAVFSLKSLYLAGDRWVASANVPHLVLQSTFPSEDRLHFRCTIPEPYAASAPYLHVFEGLLCAVPTMLDLRPARIVRTEMTPRQLDLELDLPWSRSVLDRVRRAARAAVHAEDVVALLETHRREIAEGLEAAKRSTAEIVSLFDRVPGLVFIHREATIVWVNRAAVRSLGHRDSGDLVGRRIDELFHTASRAIATERVVDAVDLESAPEIVEAELVARDGGRLLVELSPGQAVSFGGKSARLFVAHNVTERRRLQQQLAISDRLASVGMLAAGVAHEVNNPLAYVLNNIEIAQRDLAPLGDVTASSRAALTIALEGVDQIRTIVRDLLALSRVADDPIGTIDAIRVLESTLALAMPKIAEKAKLVCEPTGSPAVLGTASRLGQVLLNLIANALEAMPQASRQTNVLRVTAGPSPDGTVVIEVADTGAGIPPEHLPHVFEPFFTTKPLGKGTGLGLPISQRLVAEMGGELTFESTVGVGTTFRIRLVTP